MMSNEEREEIRRLVHQELAEIEDDISHRAGSYNYLCSSGGLTFFSHHPIGTVLRGVIHREVA